MPKHDTQLLTMGSGEMSPAAADYGTGIGSQAHAPP